MRRRDFIKVMAGSTAAWPLAVRAQQSERKRRVGVLMGLAADDAEAQGRIAAFVQGLQQLGWTDGRNLQIDYRRGAGDTDLTGRYAAELVALAPDVILASGGTVVGALLQATRTVPIVFTQTPDPVAAGFVASLARPGGNATGFTTSEYGISGKWLELLKEIAPGVTRAAEPVVVASSRSDHRAGGPAQAARNRFCRSTCWRGYHNRIGNCLRNVDGFRAGLMSTDHARPPWSSRRDCLTSSLRYL